MSEITCVVLAVKTADGGDHAKVLVQREAEYVPHRNTVVTSASIILNYECFSHRGFPTAGKNSGRFWGCYNSVFNTVSVTSSSMTAGGVFIDPEYLRGHRLGTYLMNEVVSWVKKWPEATVSPVRLYHNDGDEENTKRRNRFYQQFGLQFDFEDENCGNGLSREMKAQDLNNVDVSQKCGNIVSSTIGDYLRQAESDMVDAKNQIGMYDRTRQQLIDDVAIDKSDKGFLGRIAAFLR